MKKYSTKRKIMKGLFQSAEIAGKKVSLRTRSHSGYYYANNKDSVLIENDQVVGDEFYITGLSAERAAEFQKIVKDKFPGSTLTTQITVRGRLKRDLTDAEKAAIVQYEADDKAAAVREKELAAKRVAAARAKRIKERADIARAEKQEREAIALEMVKIAAKDKSDGDMDLAQALKILKKNGMNIVAVADQTKRVK